MKLTVTGGAGFIGHHLVAAALSRGHDVTVVDNLHRGSFERPQLVGARLVEADIRDARALSDAVEGSDGIIHLAAQSNVMGSQSDPDYTVSTNVDGTWNVARAAANLGIPKIVFASSREIYGEAQRLPVSEDHPISPLNLYGATKAAGEHLLRALPAGGPAISILRLANVIGPGDAGRVLPTWLDHARSGRRLCIFGGGQIIDFVPVGTVVDAFLRVAESCEPHEPTNIGTGTSTTLPELAHFVVSLTGSTSDVSVLPARGPEVQRFTADVHRMRTTLGIEPPARPLDSIRSWWRE